MSRAANRVDLLIGFASLLAAVVLYLAVPAYTGGGGELGRLSGLFPRIALVGVMIFSVAVISKAWRGGFGKTSAAGSGTGSAGEPAGEGGVDGAPEAASSGEARSQKVMMVATYGMIVLYIWLINRLGYHASTFLFVTAFARMLGERSWLKALVTGLLITGAIHGLARIVYLPLPTGTWGLF